MAGYMRQQLIVAGHGVKRQAKQRVVLADFASCGCAPSRHAHVSFVCFSGPRSPSCEPRHSCRWQESHAPRRSPHVA